MSGRTREAGAIFATILMLVLLVVISIPLLWAISFSFRSPETAFVRRIFVADFTLLNYRSAFYPAFLTYIFNSVVVALGTGVTAIGVATISAYAFSRLTFPGRRGLFIAVILSQLVPISTIILPVYQLLQSAGLINTRAGLVTANLSFTVPVCIWIMKGFFDRIPASLEEAAIIDGCGYHTAFARVILPISTPGLIATFIWLIIATWQELIYALTLVTRQELRTVSVGIFDFFGQWTIEYGAIFAGGIVISMPIVVTFLVLQRYFVSGLADGAVKG